MNVLAAESVQRAMTKPFTITIERHAASWRSKGEGAPEVARLGFDICVRFAKFTKPWCAHCEANLFRVQYEVSDAVRGLLAADGARPSALDKAERSIELHVENIERGPAFRVPIVFSLSVTDPGWTKPRRGKRPVADPWQTIHVEALESFLREATASAATSALAGGRAACERDLARRMVGLMAALALAEAETAGGFEARFAALREEQRAAREAAFRRIAASEREQHAEDPVSCVATDPAVRVSFDEETKRVVRVALADEGEFLLCTPAR